MKDNNAVFISFDLEHGGNKCGVTQLSAVLFRLGGFELSDLSKDVVIREVFNEYVCPPTSALWDAKCIETTGLNANHPSIVNADPIEQVWGRFITFLNKYIGLKERAILVAWNGGACDMEWIYRLTQASKSTMSLPSRVKYFLDPYRAIANTSGCKLNKKHSKLLSYSLGSVYEKVVGLPLANAHCSLADAKAQMVIVLSKEFRRVFKTKSSVQYVSEMFSSKEKRRLDAAYEPQREVHKAWSADNKAGSWKPSPHHRYLGGSQGGSDAKPSGKLVDMAIQNKCSIVDLFLEYATIKDIFQPMSKFTQYYACEEFVAPYNHCSRGSKSKPNLKPCKRSDPNARHRLKFDKKRMWKFTPGLLIAWHGILIYHGGKAGEKDSPVHYWRRMHRGTYAPFIQNTMSKHVFESCRRFLHLTNNKISNVKKGSAMYDPLYKCRKLMEKIMDRMVVNWIAGEKVCIDESMIKYSGRAISFCQYMPMKPITHGIKVFLLTCKNHTLGWEIYLGKDYKIDSSAEEVVLRLISNANLTLKSGRILYTDNWYTSLSLAKKLYLQFNWLFVGTSTPTEKKSRDENDIPFHKYSNKALESIVRGWSRRATIPIKKNGRSNHGMIQVTTWKDRKQVMFVHTHLVGGNEEGDTTFRHVKGKRQRVEIQCPAIVKDYSLNMNGVDKADRDGRDNSVTIRSNRWYLRIWFWTIERVVHCVYIVVCHIAEAGLRPDWMEYTCKNGGRKAFQLDLGVLLMEFGIRYDWGDVKDETKKPTWMRQKPLCPCECKFCFFCKEGMTNGIYHAKGAKRCRTTAKRKNNSSRSNKRKSDIGCSGLRESFDTSQYCGMCYRKAKVTHPHLTSAERKTMVQKKQNKSDPGGIPLAGCLNCNERVCKICWPDYDHEPTQKQKRNKSI